MMRNFWKATLAALSIAAFAGMAGGAQAQPADGYGYGDDQGYYGDDQGYQGYDDQGYGDAYDGYAPDDAVPYDDASGGYCDEWGCPDDYYDLPVYYGPVFYDGLWFNGPVYYRDWYGRRQYWVHGGWHYDTWRGPRPSWYRGGHYGPALGRDFYRGDRFRHDAARGGFVNRGFGQNRDSFRGSRFGNSGGAAFQNHSRFGGAQHGGFQARSAPRAQPQFHGGGSFHGGGGFHGGGHVGGGHRR